MPTSSTTAIGGKWATKTLNEEASAFISDLNAVSSSFDEGKKLIEARGAKQTSNVITARIKEVQQ